jgi:hypothetical protein
MKRIIAIMFALVMVIFLVACGNTNTQDASDNSIQVADNSTPVESTKTNMESTNATEGTKQTVTNETIGLEDIGEIEVDEGIFDVTLSIPADFADVDKTQADYDAMAVEMGYKSITLNKDGSLIYVMTKSQHREMMVKLRNNIQEALDDMCGSEDYPNFVSLKANDDYTEFEVVTKSEELNLKESFSVLGLYVYSGMYNVFNGTKVDNIHLIFINEATGNIISESNSADMAK